METEDALHDSQESANFEALCNILNKLFFTVGGCSHLAQSPSWRTTPSRLSVTTTQYTCSNLSYLEGVSSIRNSG